MITSHTQPNPTLGFFSEEEKAPSLDELKSLVKEGRLKIYYELSLPRSNSTAWQIALCEAPEIDGQINEPGVHPDLKSRSFIEKRNDKDRTSETYFKRILERVMGKKDKKTLLKENGPASLLINDLVHDINKFELASMLQLTSYIAITIRDPRLQAASVLLRVMNDTLDSPGGGNLSLEKALWLANKTEFSAEEFKDSIGSGKDKVNPKTIMNSLGKPENTELTPQLLQEAIQLALATCQRDYLEIGWENLKLQMQFIKTFSQVNSKIIIIDGSDLLENPENIMRQSAEAFNLSYTPDMVSNWKKANKENFSCSITEDWGDFAFTNQWNGPVRNSSQFEKKANSIQKIIETEKFPSPLQPALKKAIQIYEDIAFNKLSIHLKAKKGFTS